MFTVDLTRQFDVTDDDGEHDHYVQVHCELRYEPEPDLDALGSFESWFFHDAAADLDEWFTAMEGRLALLLGRRPSGNDLYVEPVQLLLPCKIAGFGMRAGRACAGRRSRCGRSSGPLAS
ncbi:hypothetical protein [Streptomyces sp. NPDC002463]|uniref:hypothetical protein n=1 Tax=Streptomyces sp. NPDC002463 TaxID=3364645 RepID=UPI00368D752E